MTTREDQEGLPVDLMDAYGDFVLNVRVVGAIGGAGVPTVPIRVPQIIVYDTEHKRQCISFSKLTDIVIMLSSSQDSFTGAESCTTDDEEHSSSAPETEKYQYDVEFTFSDPDPVVIDSEEDLLELLDRYENDGQLNLVANVQQETLADKIKMASDNSPDTTKRQKVVITTPDKGIPVLQAKRQKLDFPTASLIGPSDDPGSNAMVNLMQQLLDVQSSRMQHFADYMEDRFSQMIEHRIVSSEANMKQCLQETVQLMEEEKGDESVSVDSVSIDSSEGHAPEKKTLSASSSNLEKNVKDHMVSMELRFAKLEEQCAQTTALVKIPKQATDNGEVGHAMKSVQDRLDRMENRMDQRLENIERLMTTAKQNAETTGDAALEALNPSSRRTRQTSPSRGSNSKPPLPPQHRAAPEPPLLLPRLGEQLLEPISPTVLSTPLPPSISSTPESQSSANATYLPPHRLEQQLRSEPADTEYSRCTGQGTQDDLDSGDDDDNEALLSSEPGRPSTYSMPSLASVSGSDIPDDSAPSTPPSSSSSAQPSSSENKMKQAIKEHMQSMESRVSKLRELNNNTTPRTAPNTSTPDTTSTARTLFPSESSMEQLEVQFSEKLETLSASLQSTIQSATRDTVDHKFLDLDKLLRSEFAQLQKTLAVTKSNQSADIPPNNPRRRSSTPEDVELSEDLVRNIMDNLEKVVLSNSDTLEEKIVASLKSLLEEAFSRQKGAISSQDNASLLPEFRSLLNRRMDNVESFIQTTADESQNHIKAVQVRLQQALMDQILDALDPVIDKILNESRGSRVGDYSVATSAYATVYADHDEPSEVTVDHTAEMRSAHTSATRSTHASTHTSTTGELDLVAMDREASVRNIYGEMDIDDPEGQGKNQNHHDARGDLTSLVKRGKSLRDLCDIDTIEEEEEEELISYDRSSHTKRSNDESVITARSDSVRNIYGDAIDIDEKRHVDAPPTPVTRKHTEEEIVTPVIQNRGVVGEGDFDDEKREEEEKMHSSFVYGETGSDDEETGKYDQSFNSSEETNERKDVEASAISQDLDIDNQEGKGQGSDKASNVYENVDIEDNESKAGKKDPQVFGASLHSNAESTVVSQSTAGSELGEDTQEKKGAACFEAVDFSYDNVEIDMGVEGNRNNKSFGSLPPLDVYDDLSLDGVDETKEAILDHESSDSLDGLDESSKDSDNSASGTERQDTFDESENSEDGSEMSGYDSDSSMEDEKYFHDHSRRHLAVLAEAMTRVRLAEKGTKRYRRFQEDIFTAKKRGPLSVRVRNVSEYDASGNSGHQVTTSDDSSEWSQSYDHQPTRDGPEGTSSQVDNYEDESTVTDEYSCGSRERSKNSASIIAKAIAKYRVTNRAAKNYRRVLWDKFTAKRQGPLSIPRQNAYDDDGDSASERDNSSQDASTTDRSYDEPTPAKTEVWTEEYASETENGNENSSPSDGEIETSQYRSSKNRNAPALQARNAPSQPQQYGRPGSFGDDGSVSYEGTPEPSEDYDDMDYSLRHQSKREESPVRNPVEVDYQNDYQQQERCGGNDPSPSVDYDSTRDDMGPIRCAYVEVREGVFRRVDLAPEERFVTEASAYVEIHNRNGGHGLFRRVDLTGRTPVQYDSEGSVSGEGRAGSGEATSRIAYTRSFDEDENLGMDEDVVANGAALSAGLTNNAGHPGVLTDVADSDQQRAVPQEYDGLEEDADDSEIDDELERTHAPRRQASSGENMQQLRTPDDDIPRVPMTYVGHDLGDAILGEPNAVYDPEGMLQGNRMDPADREVEEWQNSRDGGAVVPVAGETKSPDEHDAVERVLVLDHINEIKTQIQQWEDKFLASNDGLRSSVNESIEDSHHFAAYLDKMLTDRIGQLEDFIRAQTIQNNVEIPSGPTMEPPEQSPPRTRSAPTTPMRGSLEALGDEAKDPESEETKRDLMDKIMITVEEWKELQDKLRGAEEVAEGYRKQVLQVRNVLEVKINEGNASLHQIEVLQRKLQEAHDREIEAQKQLRPVTRRVEQVIQEMVELEEYSAQLQMENGRLRELLWHAQRTV